jgi:biotin operon repressor
MSAITDHTSIAAGESQCDRIAAELRKRAGAWVSLPELALISGSHAVHSRISDLRARGLHIEHRNERKGRMIHSSYRLLLARQGELF